MLHSKRIIIWLLLFATANIDALSIPTINEEKAHEAAREQVVWNGRLCTVSTAACDFLKSVYGETTYKGLSAVQVIYGWTLRPDVWKDEPMIFVPDTELCRQLHIEGKYARFSQLFDDTLGYRLNSLASELPERMRLLVKESAPVVELDEKVGMIILLTQGQLFQPRPDSIAPLSKLQVEAEVLYNEWPVDWLAVISLAIIAIILIYLLGMRKRTITRKVILAVCLTASLCMVGCGNNKSQTSAGNSDDYATMDSAIVIHPQYAKGFQVKYQADGTRLVDVSDPQKDKDKMPISYRFALVPRGSQAETPEGYTRVEVPVERTIVMTMLQLSNFTALDAHDVVRGITGTKNLYNKDIHTRVKDGRIVKIGMEGNFDTELILAAHPQVIFISPFKRGGYDAIKETGITLIPHLGYKELDPLGQAEWVKFVGMFIGKEREANELFKGIEQRYNEMKALAAKADHKPTIFSGEMHGGNWFAVGGKNYLAQIFRDAGSEYILNNDETGGTNIEYEQMYATAANADYWRILNSFSGDFSYEALKASEPRNALFKAFKEKHVIYCNMKQTPYYERTPIEPDVVLSDLVAIFHPELMPSDYQPTYYQLLK